ncbi:MAG: hypothetical protein H6905_00200 [Hyphomicrobiales bacterium]|nr:hypothetical protein [Hyphomicrobiales bacterium]
MAFLSGSGDPVLGTPERDIIDLGVSTEAFGRGGNDFLFGDFISEGSYEVSAALYGDDGDDLVQWSSTILGDPRHELGEYRRFSMVETTLDGGSGADRIISNDTVIDDGTCRDEDDFCDGFARVRTHATGGPGDDVIDLFGTAYALDGMGPTSVVQLDFSGDDGNDTITAKADAQGSEFGFAHIEGSGGSGADAITAIAQASYYSDVRVNIDGGSWNDTIDVFVEAGETYYSGEEAAFQVFGGGGADQMTGVFDLGQYYKYPEDVPDIVYDGGSGNDHIEVTSSTYFESNFFQEIRGGNGEDTLIGTRTGFSSSEGQSILYGGNGADHLYAFGGQNNIFDGGQSTDFLNGSENTDTFVLRKDIGTDWVMNFQDGVDNLGLADGLTFDDLRIVEYGTGTRIFGDGDSLAQLLNIAPSQITADDFVLV